MLSAMRSGDRGRSGTGARACDFVIRDLADNVKIQRQWDTAGPWVPWLPSNV